MEDKGPTQRLRLIVWAPSTAQSGLPCLDAASLYAVSLLKAAHVEAAGLELSTPSTLLHRKVPLLEAQASSLELAQTPEELLAFVRTTANCPASLLEEAPSPAALSSLISREISPILLQTLWHTSLFVKHTFAIYSAGLDWPLARSWPQSMRAAMREPLARRIKALGLPEANLDAELEERRGREEMAKRAGIRIKDGMTQQEKRRTAECFGELKMLQHARSAFLTLSHALGSNEFYSGSSDPSPLDLHLFSELAPLLLHSNYQALFNSSIPELLRAEFPNLVAHTSRIRTALWPVQQGKAIGWPKGPLSDVHTSEAPGLAYGLGHALGSIFRTLKATPAFLSTAYAQRCAGPRNAAVHAQQQPVEPQAAVQQAEARKIAQGRFVWIATAVIGALATAFASGLLSVEFVDNDYEEQEKDEELEGLLSEEVEEVEEVVGVKHEDHEAEGNS